MFTEGKWWNTAQTAQTGLFHHEFTKVCRFRHFLSMPKHSRWEHERPRRPQKFGAAGILGEYFQETWIVSHEKFDIFHRLSILPRT